MIVWYFNKENLLKRKKFRFGGMKRIHKWLKKKDIKTYYLEIKNGKQNLE